MRTVILGCIVLLLFAACPGARPIAAEEDATAADAPKRALAKFEPADGKVLHGAGQNKKYFDSYCAALDEKTQPAIFMSYSGLINTGRGIGLGKDFNAMLEQYPNAMPQIGLGMGNEGAMQDQAVAEGKHDEAIKKWGELLKAVRRPVFVRIGFEFNGKHNGYHVDWYAKAFRRVVEMWREQGVDNVAAVWCATGGCGADYMDWYPGDDVVDWWAWDMFHGVTPAAKAFMRDAEKHGKPVMIGESAPRGLDTHDGKAVWDKWHKPYFQMIRDWPAVKAFCYINWDWEAVSPHWKDWGVAQIEVNEFILNAYQEEMNDPRYLHASDTLFEELGYKAPADGQPSPQERK